MKIIRQFAPSTLLFLLLLPVVMLAQNIQLTAEQQQILNSLPPAQRAQAEAAMRQAQGQVGASQPKTDSTSERDVAPDRDTPPGDPESDEFEIPRADAGTRLVVTFMPKIFLDLERSEDLAEQLA